MGHSMGGGGTLEAAKDRPSLQAAIPLTGWNTDKTWPEVQDPDPGRSGRTATRSPRSPRTRSRSTTRCPARWTRRTWSCEGASHFTPNSSNTTIAKYSISWLKRFIDNDTRYEQFLCPLPSTSLTIAEYRGNCPHTS